MNRYKKHEVVRKKPFLFLENDSKNTRAVSVGSGARINQTQNWSCFVSNLTNPINKMFVTLIYLTEKNQLFSVSKQLLISIDVRNETSNHHATLTSFANYYRCSRKSHSFYLVNCSVEPLKYATKGSHEGEKQQYILKLSSRSYYPGCVLLHVQPLS